jgi:hypothetical protein
MESAPSTDDAHSIHSHADAVLAKLREHRVSGFVSSELLELPVSMSCREALAALKKGGHTAAPVFEEAFDTNAVWVSDMCGFPCVSSRYCIICMYTCSGLPTSPAPSSSCCVLLIDLRPAC